MKIHSTSKIGSDGLQSIIVEDVPARINNRNLYEGGHYYSFHIDHKKNKTDIFDFKYLNGVPNGFNTKLKTLKDETITESEALKIAKELKGKK